MIDNFFFIIVSSSGICCIFCFSLRFPFFFFWLLNKLFYVASELFYFLLATSISLYSSLCLSKYVLICIVNLKCKLLLTLIDHQIMIYEAFRLSHSSFADVLICIVNSASCLWILNWQLAALAYHISQGGKLQFISKSAN